MAQALMSPFPALDASPANVLPSMRGVIVDARLAYPDVLHVEVRDEGGGLWRLATQDAEWSPRDPGEIIGRSILDAGIEETGALQVTLSDGPALTVIPGQREAEDDPPNWELIRPDGLVLEFGPGLRWHIVGADARVSART
jgi:hypothetical protein